MGIMDILGGAAKIGANALTGGVAGNVVNGIFGNSQQDINDRAEKFAQGQQERQIAGAKELAEQNQMQQMQMWHGTNYGAQIDEMKAAGLNPALIYGKGGSGATTGGGMGMGMPTAGTAPDQSAGARNAMDIAMMGAQLQLVEAQTEKTKAEAANEGGAKKDNIIANTASLTQGVENQKAIQELTRVETEIAKTKAKLDAGSLEYKLDEAALIPEKVRAETHIMEMMEGLTEDTRGLKVDIMKQEYANLYLQAQAIQQGINLDRAKTKEIITGIQQKWNEIGLKGTGQNLEHQDRIKAIEEYTANALKVAGINAASRVVSDVVGIATRQKGSTEQTTIRSQPDGPTTINRTRSNTY